MARSGSRRKQAQAEERPGLEPVTGGKVRRMVFEGHRVEAGRNDRKYVPRHKAPLREIEREVDNLSVARRRAAARAPPVEHEDTIYSTRSGRIEATEAPTPVAGRRRVLYLRDHDRGSLEGRRFSTVLVDELIKDVRLDQSPGRKVSKKADNPKKSPQPVPKPKAEPAPKSPTKKTADKTAAKPENTAVADKTQTKKSTRKSSRSSSASKRTAKKDDASAQCGAVTAAGKQCRNSARSGSKYCSSHKGYRPQQLEAHLAKQRTKPSRKGTKDTAPAETVAAQETVQCVALTKNGKQCRNASRRGSPYCSSHKEYKGKRADLLSAMDTKPRSKKAKDTKPSLKK